MRNHAAAATSTLMALMSAAESFVSTPTGSPSSGLGNHRVTSTSAGSPCSLGRGRGPPGCLFGSLEGCCRVGGVRRRRGGGVSSLQAKGGRAAGAAAAADGRQQQQQDEASKLSSAEVAIDGKRRGQVQQLKRKLQHFASLRMWRQAATAFDKAKADGLPVTASTYTFVINAMSKGGRWKEAIALLEEMIAGGPKIAPTVVSYNSAITACARCNKMPAAFRLLSDMSSRSGLTPDLYSYAAVMSGLVKARDSKRALELLEEMRAAGVEPDLVCLASAMEACESKGAPQEAAKVLEQVRALDPPPSNSALADILTSAIAACVTEGAWEQATDWLTDVRMANGGGLPSAAAYAAAANACARAGQGVRARALIAELESGGNGSRNGEAQRPTLACYNAVVLGCAMTGDMKGAVETLKVEVPKAGLKPDTEGFNHVIQGYAKLKDWRMALTLLDEQRSGKFPNAPPNRLSYNAAMDACGRAGQVQAAVALLDAMREVSRRNKRLRPDRYTYGGALRACREAGDDATALRLMEGMKEDGVRADQQCSLAAFSALISAGREDDAAEVLEGMVEGNVGTSEGAVVAVREGLTETLEAGGGGGGGGQGRFARVFAALDALDEARAKKAAAKAKRIAAEEGAGAAAAAVAGSSASQ